MSPTEAPERTGGQSPPPEAQSGKQINDPMSSGSATKEHDSKDQNTTDDQLAGLESNPKGPLDDSADAKKGNQNL